MTRDKDEDDHIHEDSDSDSSQELPPGVCHEARDQFTRDVNPPSLVGPSDDSSQSDINPKLSLIHLLIVQEDVKRILPAESYFLCRVNLYSKPHETLRDKRPCICQIPTAIIDQEGGHVAILGALGTLFRRWWPRIEVCSARWECGATALDTSEFGLFPGLRGSPGVQK